MIAGEHDFTIEQGATFTRIVQWKNSAGNPVDLTDYTAAMKVRESYDTGTVLISLTTGGSGIVITAGTGVLTITISATVTASLDFDRAVYDLELDDGSGVKTRLLQGHVTLEKEATK